MKRASDTTLDLSGQPVLIVTHGNTNRKVRPLKGTVTLLGRAPGCDIGLDAVDVGDIHCAICRTSAGYRVRNYAVRGVTRLNGEHFQEAPLSDGDVLQVGTFCFRLQIPAGFQPAPATPAPVAQAPDQARVRRSRRRLIRLALTLRRRLKDLRRAREADRGERIEIERALQELIVRRQEMKEDIRIERDELDKERAKWLQEQQEASTRLAKERNELEQRRNALVQARVDLDRLTTEQQQLSARLDQRQAAVGTAEQAAQHQRQELLNMMAHAKPARQDQTLPGAGSVTPTNRILAEREAELHALQAKVQLADGNTAGMARERAQLVRERLKLEQVREELQRQLEAEWAKRESGLRRRLLVVQQNKNRPQPAPARPN